MLEIKRHTRPCNAQDYIALKVVKIMRFFADAFFKTRYGHRAVVLETVAAIPGMVGSMLRHLRSLRKLEEDQNDSIKKLFEEAENERIHLMTFLHIAQPSIIERFIILGAQSIIFILYALLYMISTKTAHRLVGYLEEEAVISYTEYLTEIEKGKIENVPAPQFAIEYWKLGSNARLSDMIEAIRQDECHHRDTNHHFSDIAKHL